MTDTSMHFLLFLSVSEVNSSGQQTKMVSPANDEHVQGTNSDPLLPTNMHSISLAKMRIVLPLLLLFKGQ